MCAGVSWLNITANDGILLSAEEDYVIMLHY